MTNAELNEHTALRRGWTKDETGSWYPPGPYLPQVPYRHPPDFCGEWEHAGPLLDRLPNDVRIVIRKNLIPDTNDNGIFRCALVRNVTILGAGCGDTKTEAITRAHDAWWESEHGSGTEGE